MIHRFPMLWLASAALTIVSLACIVVGGLLIANALQGPMPIQPNPFNPASQFAQMQKPIMIGGGAAMILFGLFGAMLAGGVRVLMAIEENLRNARLPTPRSSEAQPQEVASAF